MASTIRIMADDHADHGINLADRLHQPCYRSFSSRGEMPSWRAY
jgi:hypothetical protein